jgi:hypothetical protein
LVPNYNQSQHKDNIHITSSPTQGTLYIEIVGKNWHRENKRTQSTTQKYNVETPKPEKKPWPLSKPTTRE